MQKLNHWAASHLNSSLPATALGAMRYGNVCLDDIYLFLYALTDSELRYERDLAVVVSKVGVAADFMPAWLLRLCLPLNNVCRKLHAHCSLNLVGQLQLSARLWTKRERVLSSLRDSSFCKRQQARCPYVLCVQNPVRPAKAQCPKLRMLHSS